MSLHENKISHDSPKQADKSSLHGNVRCITIDRANRYGNTAAAHWVEFNRLCVFVSASMVGQYPLGPQQVRIVGPFVAIIPVREEARLWWADLVHID